MKKYVLFTFLLLAGACRSVHEWSSSRLHRHIQASQRQVRVVELFRQQDSSNRYWSFHTDTTFYFHPDSGLHADGGLLLLWEKKGRIVANQQIYDSLTYRAEEERKVAQQSLAERSLPQWSRYGWAIVLVLAAWILWRTKT